MKLIYLLANHRSGSTLTDFSLSALKGVISGGELVRLSMSPEERKYSFGNRCQCKQSLSECAHWQSLKQRVGTDLKMADDSDWASLRLYPSERDFNYRLRAISYVCNQLSLRGVPFMPDPLAEYAQNTWRFYAALCRANAGQYLLDSSKTVTRFLNLYRQRPQDTLVIWLTRDGRGVLNSTTKGIDIDDHNSDHIVKRTIREIAREQSRFYKVYKRLPDKNKLHCKYEDLCADPDQFLQRVAKFLGTTASPFSSLLDKPYHGVPGSEHMKIRSEQLVQDNAWKSRLPTPTLSLYAEIAGPIFEKIGYSMALPNE